MAETITITEAAKRLGLDPSGLRRRCEQGKLPARKSGGTWLVEWPLADIPKAKPRKKTP